MSPETPHVDPYDPVRVHSADTDISDTQIQNMFSDIEQAYSKQLDSSVTAQILQDIRTMADIRFEGLFDNIRVMMRETTHKTHPTQNTDNCTKREARSTVGLPRWELTIGVNLNDGMLVSQQRARHTAGEQANPLKVIMDLASERPIIGSTEIAALYHQRPHTQPSLDCDVLCSYISDTLTEYDQCIQITRQDIRYITGKPIENLETDEFRTGIEYVLEQKVRMIEKTGTTGQIEDLFEEYAKPLIIRIQDHKHVHGEEAQTLSEDHENTSHRK